MPTNAASAEASAPQGGKTERARILRLAFVTGATGFVGREVVRRLIGEEWRVRALVRSSSDCTALTALGVELWPGDVTDAESLKGSCDGVDVVIHTACAVASTFDAGREARTRFLAVNREGSRNVASEVLKHAGLRMVHVSSTAAMGAPVTTHIDERSPCNPKTPYQVSKREAELALLALHQSRGLNAVILRPCVVAGEGKRESELLKLFRMVKKGRLPYIGSNYDIEKPLISLADLTSAILLAIDKGRPGEIYFVHSDGHHTLGQVVEVAGQLTGARRTHFRVPVPLAKAVARGFSVVNRFLPDWNPPLTPERVDLFIADRKIDVSKARLELGFVPKDQNLQELLAEPYRWYVKQGLV